MKSLKLLFIIILVSVSCQKKEVENQRLISGNIIQEVEPIIEIDSEVPSIHVMVALCDNENQGIVPVGKVIGNGQDPRNNLYWGAMYGVKTYFNKSADWKLLKSYAVNDTILERLIFKNTKKDIYLIADAYDGKYIKNTTIDFLKSASGQRKDSIHYNGKVIGMNGNSNLIAYIGHDGLMDFDLNDSFENTDSKQRDVIILACYSKHFFSPHLENANTQSLVWSTGLMAPEAYVLHDALQGYVQNENPKQISERAALAYHKYQKCGINAARKLLLSE